MQLKLSKRITLI